MGNLKVIMEVLQTINNKIKRGFKRPYLKFKYALGGIYHRNNFKDIRTLVLTIGFNRSGSSLVGYLLTAHPNIVIADEIQHPDTKCQLYHGRFGISYLSGMYKGFLSNLFYAILYVDRLRHRVKIPTTSLHNEAQQDIYNRSEDRSERYIQVPNQYQGHFKRLKVVGAKASHENTWALLRNNTLVNLRRHCKERDIKLKFLFTIRNPYDLIARMVIVNSFTQEEAFGLFENRCESLEELVKRIDSQDIFLYRHEDMCRDPRRQLVRLCDFLEAPIPAGYTEDCASRVVREPYKSRCEIDWSPRLKQMVAATIEKHDFLSGYDWES